VISSTTLELLFNTKKITDVALICMPFMATDRPSLGLSLLKAGLTAEGISSKIHYLNLVYAKMISLDKFNMLNIFPEADLVKEWLFTESLWGDNKKRDSQYIKDVIEGGAEEHRVHKAGTECFDCKDEILFCKDKVKGFLDYCVNEIPWNDYKIVGFSLMFQQQIASLSLAKLIKEKFPHLYIIFGGASCKGESGQALLESFPFIDAVCLGEGDIVFPKFVKAYLEGKADFNFPGFDFPGIIRQAGKVNSFTQETPVTDLNTLPHPDYDDFFEQVEQDKHLAGQNFLLMLVNSKGCWWGEKSQCTFCGLNGPDLRFRQKHAKIVIDEIIWMLERYGSHTREFYVADCIMPKEYKKTLLPQLKKLNLGIKIFYEIKANQTKEDIQLLSEAGVTGIQPGIESLSTRVLKIMRKGVTSLQNIQLLKNCLQFGVAPKWNYLTGFPGETYKDYEGQADLIPALQHLTPPLMPGIRRIRFDRFSVYQAEPAKYNLKNMRPYTSYQYIFSGLSPDMIDKIAYHFICDFDGQDDIGSYTKSIGKACKGWIDHQHEAALFTMKKHDDLVLYDFRPGFSKSSYTLQGDTLLIFKACEQIQKRKYLEQLLSKEKLDSILNPLIKRKWIIEENNKYLNLAVSLDFNYFPPEGVWHELENILQ